MKQTVIAFLSISILLSSCAPTVPAQSLIEITGTSGSEKAILPTPIPTENKRQKMESTVAAHLAGDPDMGRTYVQYVHGLDEASLIQHGVDFLEEIRDDGQRLVPDGDVSIGVNNYGILYAEALDNSTVVFNIKDNDGNYLIATKEEAINRLTQANPDAITGKTIDSFTLTTEVINGILVSLIDENGQQVMGVNPNTKQWEILIDGAFATAPTAEPTATTNENISDKGLVEVDQEVISAMVKDFAAGTTEFPSDLSREQYSAFIKEMNAQRGQKPIYTEAFDNKTGERVTLYLNKDSRKMEPLPGTYAENKATIDQHSYPLYAEVYQEEGQDLQYLHPDTGELMTLPNSANVDWTKVIDESNLKDGYMELSEFLQEWLERLVAKGRRLHQMILLDKEPIVILETQEDKYIDRYTLNTLFMRTNEQGKPLYAARVFVGTISRRHSITVEGDSTSDSVAYSVFNQSPKELDKLTTNHIYYASIAPNQTQLLADASYGASTIKLSNLATTANAYHNAVEQMLIKDGNVTVIGEPLILKK